MKNFLILIKKNQCVVVHLLLISLINFSGLYCKSRSINNSLVLNSHYGKLEDVKRQINNGMDPSSVNTKGNSAIFEAAFNGHKEVVKFFVLGQY